MPLEVIYVTRHGFRSNWLVDPATGNYSASIRSPTGISADPELTSHGVDQARELGAHLMTVDPPIEAVYSSPYYRCLQTITPFVQLKEEALQRLSGGSSVHARNDPITIRPDHGLCEWYGSAPFDHPSPASPDVLKGMFPAFDEGYQSAVFPARRGESVEQLYERVAAGVQSIINQCDSEGKRAVVLCSHAATVIALGRVLTGIVPESVEAEDFRAFTCGLSVYRRKSLPQQGESVSMGNGAATTSSSRQHDVARPDSWNNGRGVSGGWSCEVNSDCSFLNGGEERGWRFSGDESFHKAGESGQSDAGVALGVVVESKRLAAPVPLHKAAGNHRL